MVSLSAVSLPINRKKGSVSHTFHKRKTGVQLFGLSEGCTPTLLIKMLTYCIQSAIL